MSVVFVVFFANNFTSHPKLREFFLILTKINRLKHVMVIHEVATSGSLDMFGIILLCFGVKGHT